MFKVGLSTCDKEITQSLFDDYKKASLDCAEICLSTDAYKSFDIKRSVAYAKNSGININSYHLPYSLANISKKEYADESVALYSEDIKRVADSGIDKFILHLSGEIFESDPRDEFKKCAKESTFKLVNVAESEGVTIAIENLPRNCLGNSSAEIEEFLEIHPNLRVCLDTNHLTKEPLVDFIKNLGNKIITTHISDFDLVDEKHWLPGKGKINWQEVIDTLKSINYQGVWLYELGFTCPATISRSRELTCEDFANNAKALFSGKIPPIIK